MATEIAQRELRNRTAELLRRVEAGERLRITVHGHPVADLGPIEDGPAPGAFASLEAVFADLTGALDRDDRWDEEIGELRAQPGGVVDPFEDLGGSRRRPNEP